MPTAVLKPQTNPELGHALEQAARQEIPPADLCARIAKCYHDTDQPEAACRWALRAVDAGDHYIAWQACARLLDRISIEENVRIVRKVRLAILGSYTTTHFAPLVVLAALRAGVHVEIYQSDYGQYQQEVLDPDSGMRQFRPDFVLLAVHQGDTQFPSFSRSPTLDVRSELERWTGLWGRISSSTGAVVLQHNFAAEPETAWGHLGARLTGSRDRLLQELNLRLGEEAMIRGVGIVDCERLSSAFGKRNWFSPRYWRTSRQAVALDALPMLARNVASLVAAFSGLTKKCVVLDLDNTLWGGVVGEDRLSGICLGEGPEGEAYVGFQDYLLQLKQRGVILAVCSKNNEADAREPFERHAGMRIRLSDIAMFVANWRPKPENIRSIAKTLNIGLDSMVFVDDSPAERQLVRESLPEVDVITLPKDPALYTRALADYPWLEPSSYTREDEGRTEHYQARAKAACLSESPLSLEDFYRGLQMEASVKPFTDDDLPRITQLIGKTNQFNTTTRRYKLSEVRGLALDPEYLTLSLRLRDRFADHGLVSILIGRRLGTTVQIDSWLMSCRVIGRTVENHLFMHLCRHALEAGFGQIRGVYIQTAKNALVKDLFSRLGFELALRGDGSENWVYDLAHHGQYRTTFIQDS